MDTKTGREELQIRLQGALTALGGSALDIALHLMYFGVSGKRRSALDNPLSAFLTKVMPGSRSAVTSSMAAIVYFPDEDPIGISFHAMPQLTDFMRAFDNGQYGELLTPEF